MSESRICISIAGSTADEVLQKVDSARAFSDYFEIRFDRLQTGEAEKLVDRLKPPGKFVFTYRPADQGGQAPVDPMRRIMFWINALGATTIPFEDLLIDHECDLGEAFGWPPGTTVIRSFHDFDGVPAHISSLADELLGYGRLVKIAGMVNDASDAIPLWKLLEKPGALGRMIPVAMGEAGKWTRILGPAHGAYMTYASLDREGETAPGQIVAEDTITVFRVNELRRDTLVHGIIAGDTTYSVSPWMHNAAFKTAGLDRVFIPLQVRDLVTFLLQMVKQATREVDINFAGFSVTNPHKQAIIPHLDEIDETARMIGAVNTVAIDRGGRLIGLNTDADGFIIPLKANFIDLRDARVAIVGAGGAARACAYSLVNEGADVTLIARNFNQARLLADEFGLRLEPFHDNRGPFNFDVLVNATPLGTSGEAEHGSIAVAEQLSAVKLVYDLVYNPAETRLIREAKKAGVSYLGGLEMLIAQGARQFEIWTGETAPVKEMEIAVRRKLGI